MGRCCGLESHFSGTRVVYNQQKLPNIYSPVLSVQCCHIDMPGAVGITGFFDIEEIIVQLLYVINTHTHPLCGQTQWLTMTMLRRGPMSYVIIVAYGKETLQTQKIYVCNTDGR